MTGNIVYLSNFKEFDGDYVTFGGGAYGGKISGKGTLKTDSLDFEDVYFVNELKFNLFSVSQMCDKKNYVLFTDTECLVLSPNFKLPDESLILLNIPRKDNMYSFDMKNIVPKESLTCLVAKATLDESMLWHRRLGHINFKNINKLIKDNLVRLRLVVVMYLRSLVLHDVISVACSIGGPKDMFTMGASHTLEATHIEFFTDEDESEVDLGNITNSYTVPITPNTIIHKDHPIDNVIGDVKSSIEPTSIAKALSDSSWVEAMQEELFRFKLQQVWILVDLPSGKTAIGTKWVFRNKKDERGIMIRNKARSAFLYGTIEEEVYVTKPPGFKDPDHPDKVYKVVKALYGLHQAPRTWITSKNRMEDGNICISQSMIGSLMYLTASRPAIMFVVCACARFQVTPKTSHLLTVKRIFRYLKGKPTLGLWYSRDSSFELVAYTDSDYAGTTQDRKSTTGGSAASFCGQVLWIQNQLLDYGYNFMNTVININNNNLLTKGFDAGRSQYLVSSMSKEVETPRYLSLVVPLKKVGDEDVHKEVGDKMERAATTASSLEAE
ncbi:ribonuclease H-like domain-containing protein [Tanacetum coccineum]